MKTTKGYYSLIQYCPDLSRMEAANVGVILFCPELQFIRARVSRGNDRIRRFFRSGDHDWAQINAVKESIEQRLEVDADAFQGLDDLEKFRETRANEIQVTPPRFVKVSEPETDLLALFDELVGGRTRKTTSDQAAPVRRELSQVFAREHVDELVQKDITVEVPAFRRAVHVPFGFQNGAFNLIQPIAFSQKTEEGIVSTTCRIAVEGMSLQKHRHRDLGSLLYNVVGGFSKEASAHIPVVQDIMAESNVRFLVMSDVNQLIDEIRSTVHPLPLG